MGLVHASLLFSKLLSVLSTANLESYPKEVFSWLSQGGKEMHNIGPHPNYNLKRNISEDQSHACIFKLF